MLWGPLTLTSLTRHGRVTAALLRTTIHHTDTKSRRGHGRVCWQVVRMASNGASPKDAAPTWKERQRSHINVHECSKEAVASGKPKIIIITGPTAVGKSNTALAVAKELNGEIISADSVQVYRGMDTGSDKLPVERRQGIPHHMMDVMEPHEEFSVGIFYEMATRIADDIISRGKVPILVGGSGFYLRWFMFGKPSTPEATPEIVRQADEVLSKAIGDVEAAVGHPLEQPEAWKVATELVASLGDPVSAKRLQDQPNTWYRMRRVLQILLHTGQPLSEQDINLSSTLRYDVRAYFLFRPRMDLYRRIDVRCEQMLLTGLVQSLDPQESCELLRKGLLPDSCTAARAIGYRQMLWYLVDCHRDASFISPKHLLDCLKDIQSATRRFCHRQYTWFRGDDMFTWVDASAPTDEVVQTILDYAAEPFHVGGTRGKDTPGGATITKEEANALRRYVPSFKLLGKATAVERVLDLIRAHLPTGIELQGELSLEGDGRQREKTRNMPVELKPVQEGAPTVGAEEGSTAGV